jgi:1-acyl-sn-glycerol-3-phosphate acyltransferase
MVGKNYGVIDTMRSVVTLIWVLTSVVFFGTACFITSPFNARITRTLGLWWIKLILIVAGIKVVVQGAEKLRVEKRYVFIANHQSHIDIPVLIGGMRHHLSFIAKKELFSIPFFGWGMYGLGHIWIDRTNARKAHASIQRAIKRLQKDTISLVLFPEGTRSLDGKIGQFKQGSFLLAQQAGVEIVPIAIRNTSRLLPKHTLMVTHGTAYLTICDPITVDESMTKGDISERVHGIIAAAIEHDSAGLMDSKDQK